MLSHLPGYSALRTRAIYIKLTTIVGVIADIFLCFYLYYLFSNPPDLH